MMSMTRQQRRSTEGDLTSTALTDFSGWAINYLAKFTNGTVGLAALVALVSILTEAQSRVRPRTTHIVSVETFESPFGFVTFPAPPGMAIAETN